MTINLIKLHSWSSFTLGVGEINQFIVGSKTEKITIHLYHLQHTSLVSSQHSFCNFYIVTSLIFVTEPNDCQE
jgi:hypothetical protein